MQKRGELTVRVAEKSKEVLGYQISIDELMLMLYIQYVMVNEQFIERSKINLVEAKIVKEWVSKGYLTKGTRLTMTKKFWDAINEILFLAYVDIE